MAEKREENFTKIVRLKIQVKLTYVEWVFELAFYSHFTVRGHVLNFVVYKCREPLILYVK